MDCFKNCQHFLQKILNYYENCKKFLDIIYVELNNVNCSNIDSEFLKTISDLLDRKLLSFGNLNTVINTHKEIGVINSTFDKNFRTFG
ncbi:hypothetical protein HZS_6448 [Henneguya salminicola]|nr:hypothetical protein HZS_6448 [Henneguya salminicola]